MDVKPEVKEIIEYYEYYIITGLQRSRETTLTAMIVGVVNKFIESISPMNFRFPPRFVCGWYITGLEYSLDGNLIICTKTSPGWLPNRYIDIYGIFCFKVLLVALEFMTENYGDIKGSY